MLPWLLMLLLFLSEHLCVWHEPCWTPSVVSCFFPTSRECSIPGRDDLIDHRLQLWFHLWKKSSHHFPPVMTSSSCWLGVWCHQSVQSDDIIRKVMIRFTLISFYSRVSGCRSSSRLWSQVLVQLGGVLLLCDKHQFSKRGSITCCCLQAQIRNLKMWLPQFPCFCCVVEPACSVPAGDKLSTIKVRTCLSEHVQEPAVQGRSDVCPTDMINWRMCEAFSPSLFPVIPVYPGTILTPKSMQKTSNLRWFFVCLFLYWDEKTLDLSNLWNIQRTFK